jgi:hypothetical protein
MPTPAYAASDGPRVILDQLIKDPLQIPALVYDIAANEFIVDTVLRNGGVSESGLVQYHESTPLYADGIPEVRAEFAEVPVMPTSVGAPRAVRAHERSMAIMISDEMRRRQLVDPVRRQISQVTNTMVYFWNQAFINGVFANTSVQTQVSSNPCASSNATIRADLANAQFLIDNANIVSSQGVPQWLMFKADTLIINHYTASTLKQSSSFAAPYLGNIANENLQYTGKLPNQIFGLDVLVSRQVPVGNAILMQRKEAGFIVDELPLTVTPLRRDEDHKCWKADVQRAAAIGFDQPLAVCILSNI